MTMPRVTWEGLAAWCALTGIELAPWEANAMVRLGNVRAIAMTPEPAKDIGSNGFDRSHRTGGKKRRGEHTR